MLTRHLVTWSFTELYSVSLQPPLMEVSLSCVPLHRALLLGD